MEKKEICRLCNVELVETSSYVSLLEEETANMLFALTSIKVNSNDGISNVACSKCYQNLKFAYKIQQGMIKANERFFNNDYKIIHETVDIKLEELSEEPQPATLHDNQCFICGVFVGDNLLNSHINEHFHQEQKCDLCNLIFYNIQLYHTHNLVHHNLENSLYQCEKCEFKFRYKTIYDMHMENIHRIVNNSDLIPEFVTNEIERKITSPILQNNVVTENNLVYKKKVYNKDKLAIHTCEVCSRSFPTRSRYATHMAVHKERKTCPICQKSLSVTSYPAHVRAHTDVPQMCDLCGATLKNQSCLRMHMHYSHNKNEFKCSLCDKTFKKKFTRDHHERSVHGEPNQVCDICGKRFASLFQLTTHTKITHLKLRPYVCEYCKKTFSRRHALATHRRQHTNETPYKCDVCGEGFRQKVSLRGHQKSKHGIEEPKICECKECGKAFASDWALQTHHKLLH